MESRDFESTAAKNTVIKMGRALFHRGPDDAGDWVEGFGDRGVAFSHARLAIVGLGPSGHQPMISSSGRFVLVFNGEIYNHLSLRKELGRKSWNGNSDTETLLACVEHWGLRASLDKANGMFALAIWDRKRRKLILARDRLGEKPLYYGWCDDVFLFGSELKALKRHPKFEGIVSRDSLALLMRHRYIPAPYSIYEGIFKLMPGTILEVGPEESGDALPVANAFWSIADVVEQADGTVPSDDAVEVSHFETVLSKVVKEQMMADVSIGAFLSGGVDSSTVVALMQANSSRQVNTFNIGFHKSKLDESKYARAVARHLGTHHNELFVSADDALRIIPSLPSIYDEPFADSSQIPTFILSKLTSNFVTVALSGDGGDEILGGYARYSKAEKMWSRLSEIPEFARKPLAVIISSLQRLAPRGIDVAASTLTRGRASSLSNRLGLLGAALNCTEDMEYYRQTISHWRNPSEVVIGAEEPSTVLTDRTSWPDLTSFRSKMMYADMQSYLPDDILVKIDRAAMAVGLETRVPLLDSRVVEAALRLPDHLKFRDGQSKWILRQVLSNYVPNELINRPKMGFSIPLADWLRGPLREWAECLLNEDRLTLEGYFRPELVRARWEDHVDGVADWQNVIWPILMFQSWLELE